MKRTPRPLAWGIARTNPSKSGGLWHLVSNGKAIFWKFWIAGLFLRRENPAVSVVARDVLLQLLESDKLRVISTDDEHPFEKEEQVQDDGIDLRLGTHAFAYREDVTTVGTLDPDSARHFRAVELGPKGYTIPPHGILFCSTLEIVCLSAGEYLGRITGRSLWARFGLSVHCTQTKVSSGIRSVVPLQLVNHTDKSLVVYPRQRIVQLQLELLYGTSGPYGGVFSDEYQLRLPEVKESERRGYDPSDLECTSNQMTYSPVPSHGERDAVVPSGVESFQLVASGKLASGRAPWLTTVRRLLDAALGATLLALLTSDPPPSRDGVYWKVLFTAGVVLALVVNLSWDLLQDRLRGNHEHP